MRFLSTLVLATLVPGIAASAASPFARPAWLRLENAAYYSSLNSTYPDWWPDTVDAGGNLWSPIQGCFSPDGVDPLRHSFNAFGLSTTPDLDDGSRLVVAADVNVPTQMRITRYRCGEQPLEVGVLDGYLPYPFPSSAQLFMEGTLPGHQPCISLLNDVVCFDVTMPTPVPWKLFTAADLQATLLPGDLRQTFPALEATAYLGDWMYRSVLPLPGGRVLALVSASINRPGFPGDGWVASWIVERRSDGTLLTWVGPELYKLNTVDNPRPSLFWDAQRLFYDAETNSVLVWSVPTRLIDQGLKGTSDRRFAGAGFLVLPLDGSAGYGLIDLQQLLMEQPSRLVSGKLWSIVRGPAGKVFFAFGDGPGARLKELRIDPAAADLDRDGLSGAQEAALKTSDSNADSDSGGTRDGIEALLDATDPTQGADDSVATYPDVYNWSFSTLVQNRVPLTVLAFQWQQVPFVCGDAPQLNVPPNFRCFDASGRQVVGGLPFPPGVAADGSSVVWSDGTKFRRRTLADGREEVLADVNALNLLLQTDFAAGLSVPIVGPNGRVYVASTMGVALLGDGAPRLLWSRDQAACDALMGTCAPSFPPPVIYKGPPETPAEFRLLGYDADRDRLLGLFVTNLDSYLFSFGVDKPTLVLRQGLDFPHVVIVSPIGPEFDRLSALLPRRLLKFPPSRWLAHWYNNDLRDPDSYGLLDSGFASSGNLESIVPGVYSGGWDTSMMLNSSAFGESQELVEMPRLEYRLLPGDVLTWIADSRPTIPSGFMKSGPRGGLLQLSESKMHTIRGVGVAADGRMCLVSATGELNLSFELGPNGLGKTWAVVGAAHDSVDCLFDEQDRLVYLAASPARIGVVLGDTVEEFPLPDVAPQRLARGGSPGLYRIATGGPLVCYDTRTEQLTTGSFNAAGMTTTRGGWLVAITAPDARLVRVPDARACAEAPEEMARPWAGQEAHIRLQVANLAERPDGLILMQRAKWSLIDNQITVYPVLHAFDPRTKTKRLVGAAELAPAFALVPGAAWCDPWEPMVPKPACWTMDPPGTPEHADAGVPVGPADGGGTPAPPDPRRGCGCSTGAAPLSASLAMVAAALALARARRRRW